MPRERGLRAIIRILNETPHDTLYLNSFFDPVFTLRPLLARRLGLVSRSRCALAPRGEFSEGALALKRRKKEAYLLAAQASGLYRNLTWQASSKNEMADIRRVQGAVAQDIRVAANLPRRDIDVAATRHRPRAEGEPLRLCFLSRISPKKNLDFALRVLCRVHVPVKLDIYGPLEDKQYWSECKALMPKLPCNVLAEYCGECDHFSVPTTLANYDLFFFPDSRRELRSRHSGSTVSGNAGSHFRQDPVERTSWTGRLGPGA